MFDRYQLDFDSPWYLLLFALAPLLWLVGRHSLSGLGSVRRWLAMALRLAVLSCLVLAAAEVRWVRKTDRLTVIYLLDQSLSIPTDERTAMRRYVNELTAQHRQGDDRAGVIVFGREAAIEIPPIDDNVPLPETVEALLDPEFTNLAGAMRLAMAAFPEDAAKRIVVISDGNENLGSALEQAKNVVESGVGIDVQPVFYRRRAEVSVEKLAVPPMLRKGQPFDVRVVLENTAEPTADDPGVVPGRLIVSQRTSDQPVTLSEQHIDLAPGKHVLTLRQQLDEAAAYTYEARFVPDNAQDDAMAQNNRATGFAHLRGAGQVLLIEDAENRGQHERLMAHLRAEQLEVTLTPSDQLFTNLTELQPYDAIILADVPREDFSEPQIKMLVRNTEQLGCGLVMIGGPNSFGAGGWTNTEIEKAMPVDFQIKDAKVSPRGALAMVMHASEMAEGNHWQKVIAQEAIKALGPEDYCGVLHWEGREQWLWGQPNGLKPMRGNREQMLARLDRMTPGDMPDFDPSLNLARVSLAALKDTAIKHAIVISDGDPSPPSSGVIRSMVAAKITVSTVAVATHGPAGSSVLKQLATQTGGKYYEVRNPKALPRIFQKEARRVAAPLVYEVPPPFAPQVITDHEILRGLNPPLPPIKGYVLTQVKENPLVEVILRAPRPADPANNTILAGWTYGLGRTVALTTDDGARWATDWTAWDGFEKLSSQMIRWVMRPVAEQGKFSVATDVRDGQAQVVITSLDSEEQFQNFLSMSGTVVGPNMEPIDVKVEQTAPGRYVGKFPALDDGSYFVMVNPGPQQAPLRTGINVPYSAEYRTRTTDQALLESLARMAPRGGQPGQMLPAVTLAAEKPSTEKPAASATIDPFRHDLPRASRTREAWHYAILLGSCLFFFDVFTRRVALSFAWVAPLAGAWRDRILGRSGPLPVDATLERLRSRKEAVDQQIEQRRAATSFEPTPESTTEDVVGQELADAGPAPTTTALTKPAANLAAPQADQTESYTERLLKAKKKARDERKDS